MGSTKFVEGAENRWRYPRFFVNKAEFSSDVVRIFGDNAKHIGAVLRGRPGDKLVLCDGERTDWLAEIVAAEKNEISAKLIEARENPAEPTLFVRVLQCVPKADKLDFILQKAVELGAAELVPVLSARCVSRPDEKNWARKIARWQKIAEEAASQSGRGIIPRVCDFTGFNAALQKYKGDDLGMILYECGGEKCTEIFSRARGVVNILVGPEGGFTPEEAALAVGTGFHAVHLGERILRTETASLGALAVLMNLTGNL